MRSYPNDSKLRTMHKIEYCSHPVSLNTASTYKKIIARIINY